MSKHLAVPRATCHRIDDGVERQTRDRVRASRHRQLHVGAPSHHHKLKLQRTVAPGFVPMRAAPLLGALLCWAVITSVRGQCTTAANTARTCAASTAIAITPGVSTSGTFDDAR